MKGHPGGAAHTLAMLEASRLTPPARILDMGAGAGESLALLKELGFDAVGIDLAPRGDGVGLGDFLAPGFPEGSFDGILSQCAFFVSGDVPGALDAARRMLKPGGTLMLSDVTPAGMSLAELAGRRFQIIHHADITPQWKEYVIDAIWRGEEVPCLPRGQKFRYEILIAKKEEPYGLV